MRHTVTLQGWRNQLVEELRRQGLPGSHVDRLVEEFTDHATDVLSENQSMDAEQTLESRLGTPEQLAKDEFNRTTFAGRHPILTFVVGPIAAVFVALLIPILPVILAGEVCLSFHAWNNVHHSAAATMKEQPSTVKDGFLQGVGLFVRFVPFMLATWFFVSMGWRAAQQKWSVLACCLISFLAIFFVCLTNLECVGWRNGIEERRLIMFGLGYSWDFDFTQTIQAVVSLSFGLCTHLLFWTGNRFNRLSVQYPSRTESDTAY